ncbi:paired amphipathic helix protein Sin3-like protein 2 isoform X1 [Tanacetum coccineum]
MLLESVNSALKRVEELLNGIKNHSVSSEGSIRVEDHFSALNLRCIERLYGDRGLEVIETLRKCPSTAQDSKDLSTKCLVAEIKETKEKSRKDDDVLYSVAAGKVCSTKEQVNQVLKLGTTFLELMLYVPSRPENSDNVEYVEISTCGATTNEGDSDGSLGANSVTFNNVKQGKLACNGDDNVSPKRVDSSKRAIVGVVNDNVLLDTRIIFACPTLRPRNVHVDGHEAKSNIDDVPSSQQGDTSRTPPVANTNFAKFEKEEGELSPNVYFDEAYLLQLITNGSNAKEKHSMEIDADADEEDTKNVLENGKIIKMETVMILMVKQKAKERPRG